MKNDDAANFELFLAGLQGILSSDDIELDEEERKQRGKPWNSYHKVDSYPMAIVSPNSTEQVWFPALRFYVLHQCRLSSFLLSLFDTSEKAVRASDGIN